MFKIVFMHICNSNIIYIYNIYYILPGLEWTVSGKRREKKTVGNKRKNNNREQKTRHWAGW